MPSRFLNDPSLYGANDRTPVYGNTSMQRWLNGIGQDMVSTAGLHMANGPRDSYGIINPELVTTDANGNQVTPRFNIHGGFHNDSFWGENRTGTLSILAAAALAYGGLAAAGMTGGEAGAAGGAGAAGAGSGAVDTGLMGSFAGNPAGEAAVNGFLNGGADAAYNAALGTSGSQVLGSGATTAGDQTVLTGDFGPTGGLDPETFNGAGGMGVGQNGIGPGTWQDILQGTINNPSSLYGRAADAGSGLLQYAMNNPLRAAGMAQTVYGLLGGGNHGPSAGGSSNKGGSGTPTGGFGNLNFQRPNYTPNPYLLAQIRGR